MYFVPYYLCFKEILYAKNSCPYTYVHSYFGFELFQINGEKYSWACSNKKTGAICKGFQLNENDFKHSTPSGGNEYTHSAMPPVLCNFETLVWIVHK